MQLHSSARKRDMFEDPLFWVFVLPGLLLGAYAQSRIKMNVAKYSRVATDGGITGAQVARRLLDSQGLQNVTVESTPGMLSDHYDPRSKTLRLSQEVYFTPSVAAAGIAAHEAGHALVAKMLPNADPPHKISIVARGMALGYTKTLSEDRYLLTHSQFKDMIASLLGGHTAEELTFNETTTGGQDDIERATKMARKMVTDFGMSEKLGPRTFGHKEELVFLGREIAEQRDYSDKVAEQIDDEVHNIIQQAHELARKTLTENNQR